MAEAAMQGANLLIRSDTVLPIQSAPQWFCAHSFKHTLTRHRPSTHSHQEEFGVHYLRRESELSADHIERSSETLLSRQTVDSLKDNSSLCSVSAYRFWFVPLAAAAGVRLGQCQRRHRDSLCVFSPANGPLWSAAELLRHGPADCQYFPRWITHSHLIILVFKQVNKIPVDKTFRATPRPQRTVISLSNLHILNESQHI